MKYPNRYSLSDHIEDRVVKRILKRGIQPFSAILKGAYLNKLDKWLHAPVFYRTK